jgi:fumarate reductase flavoprotein subunit
MIRKILSIVFPMVVFTFLLGCHKEMKNPAAPEPFVRQVVASVCNDCHDTLKAVLSKDHPPTETGALENCQICHSKMTAQGGKSFDLIIHLTHYATEDITENCLTCHRLDKNNAFGLTGVKRETGIKVETAVVEKMAPYFRSWAHSGHLDHKHAGNGATCRSCHETYFPDSRASMDQCLLCHVSYEHVAELTREVEPNPHRSHYEDLRCTLCHKAHQPSELYCDTCHEFDLTVP